MSATRCYLFDTSVFINSWHKYYPPSVFITYWQFLDQLIDAEAVVSCWEVYKEIERQRDNLFDWCKDRKAIFEKPSEETTIEMVSLMNKYPNFAAVGGSKNAADPWVIAHAKLRGAIVVTDEHFAEKQRPTKPPKIPNVCDELGVQRRTIVEFLSENEAHF